MNLDAIPDAGVTEAAVLDALREVMDPELGMNLVELGLIYSVGIAGGRVEVKMTLTTPGCPMHEQLARGVRLAVLRVEGVEDVDVEVVWEPAWEPSMMTEEARCRLGIR